MSEEITDKDLEGRTLFTAYIGGIPEPAQFLQLNAEELNTVLKLLGAPYKFFEDLSDEHEAYKMKLRLRGSGVIDHLKHDPDMTVKASSIPPK